MKNYWQTDWMIGLIVTLFFMLASVTDLNRGIELAGYDLGVRFSSTKTANQDVVIIKIDEASLQEKGGWPWPRDILAQATRIIASARPAVVGYVLPLAREQSAHGLEYIHELKDLVRDKSGRNFNQVKRLLRKAEIRMNTDQTFANSLSRAGRVVLAIPFLESEKSKQATLGLTKHAKIYLKKCSRHY